MSFSVFWTLNYFFPPNGLGEEAPFVDEVLYGMEQQISESGNEEKSEQNSEKHGAVASVSV